MKTLLLLTFLFTGSVFSKVVSPNIDEDLDYKVQTDEETQQRSLAGEDELEEVTEPENSDDSENSRDLASEKEGVNPRKDGFYDFKFWKY